MAIDYALLIVVRFREELVGGATVGDAVVKCTERAGRSVFFKGLAVAIGILGPCLPFPSLRSIGTGGAIVAFLSVAVSLTLMPAMLGVLGPRINAVRVVPHRPAHESRFGAAGFPISHLAAVGGNGGEPAAHSRCIVPVLHLKLDMPSATALPSTVESRVDTTSSTVTLIVPPSPPSPCW